jgi:hypothetical protein
MAENKVITFKTININKQDFLNVINPDQIYPETQGYLSFNTGIYGTKIDNAMPDFCIDLYQNAAGAHQNLVNLKANLILGNNLQAEDDADEAEVNQWIAKRNKAGDNLKVVYGKASKDMALFNAAVLQVVYNREGQIAEVYHVPCQNFRLGKPNKYGQIEYGFLSPNWGMINNSKQSKGVKDYVKIRMFDPSNWKKHPVQLMYLKDYSYGYYAMPAYSAAINWLLVSREISDFHKNNIRSNFFLSGMLTQKKGGMTDEQIEENAQAIEQFYKGGVGRKVLLSYVEDMVNDKPTFERFSPDDQDKLFDVLSQQAFQQIVTAHNAYSILAGVDSKGSDLGGDSNKLNVCLQAFNYLVCEGMKTILIDGLNRIQEINDAPALMCITEPLKITLPVAQPEDLTVNERRAMLYGLPEIDNSSNDVAPTNEIPAQ